MKVDAERPSADCEHILNRIQIIRNQFTSSRITNVFSVLCFVFPPVLGSAVSFIFNGGRLWSVFEIASKRKRFNFDPPMLALTIAFYAYCGAYLIATVANISFVRDTPHLIPLVTFLFFPFSYSTWSIVKKDLLARIIMLSSAAACCGALLLAIIQYYWIGMLRAEGGAGNAIVFATVVCLGVMVCLAGALSGIEKGRNLLFFGFLAGTIAILYSGSRIMWVAIPIAGLAVLLIHRRNLSRNFLRLLLALAGIGIVAGIFGFRAITVRVDALFTDWAELGAQGGYDTALGLRVALWHIGLDAFRQMPLFGHGVGSTEGLIAQGFQSQFGLQHGFSHFHNGLLTALVEAGILGAVTLVAIFVVAIRNAGRVLRVSSEPVERFGATMILIAVITYLTGGTTGILVGHDILDSMLVIFLITGTYLASGRTAVEVATLGQPSAQQASAAGQVEG